MNRALRKIVEGEKKYILEHGYAKPSLFYLYYQYKFGRRENCEVENRLKELSYFKKFFGLPGKRILDLGCGKGGISLVLANEGALVYSTDVDSDMLTMTRDLSKTLKLDLKVINCDAENLPFQNSFFDAIVLFNVMEHIPNKDNKRENTISEISRVLRRNGLFFMSAPNIFSLREGHSVKETHFAIPFLPRKVLRHMIEKQGDQVCPDFERIKGVNYFKLKKVLAKNGFAIQEVNQRKPYFTSLFHQHIFVICKKC